MSVTAGTDQVTTETFSTTTGEPVVVSRRISADGRTMTYGAVYGERVTARHRTFDDALAAVGLQVHRFRNRKAEIKPADSAEETAA